jgi:hypothetical protein
MGMEQRFDFCSKVIYCIIAIALMLLTLVLVVLALWALITDTLAGKSDTFRILESVGLIIVSVAIFDVSKFLIEEEVLRDRELRSIREARRSLTKFMTIIIIAISLEALVSVFETTQEHVQWLLYPSLLLLSAVLALVGLGFFQWLSSKADVMLPRESPTAEQESQRENVASTGLPSR